MPHREGAAKDSVDTTGSEQAPNRAVREPEGAQLVTGDDAMLSPGQLGKPKTSSAVSFARYADLSHSGNEFAPGFGKMRV